MIWCYYNYIHLKKIKDESHRIFLLLLFLVRLMCLMQIFTNDGNDCTVETFLGTQSVLNDHNIDVDAYLFIALFKFVEFIDYSITMKISISLFPFVGPFKTSCFYYKIATSLFLVSFDPFDPFVRWGHYINIALCDDDHRDAADTFVVEVLEQRFFFFFKKQREIWMYTYIIFFSDFRVRSNTLGLNPKLKKKVAVVQSNAVGFNLNKFTGLDHFRQNRVGIRRDGAEKRTNDTERERARELESDMNHGRSIETFLLCDYDNPFLVYSSFKL